MSDVSRSACIRSYKVIAVSFILFSFLGQAAPQVFASTAQDVQKETCDTMYVLYHRGSLIDDVYNAHGKKIFGKNYVDLTENDITLIYNTVLQCSEDDERKIEILKKNKKDSTIAYHNSYFMETERDKYIKRSMQSLQSAKDAASGRKIALREKEEREERERQDKQFVAENSNKALALLKNSYFADYPKAQGYKPIQKAFESFFSKPSWEIKPDRTGSDGWEVAFNGIATWNNQNSRFTFGFYIHGKEVREGNMTISWCSLSVNGNSISVQSRNNALATIFLN